MEGTVTHAQTSSRTPCTSTWGRWTPSSWHRWGGGWGRSVFLLVEKSNLLQTISLIWLQQIVYNLQDSSSPTGLAAVLEPGATWGNVGRFLKSYKTWGKVGRFEELENYLRITQIKNKPGVAGNPYWQIFLSARPMSQVSIDTFEQTLWEKSNDVSVGVAGYLLGGGVNWLGTYNKWVGLSLLSQNWPRFPRYGYGAENILSMRVVLADGRVAEVTAEKTEVRKSFSSW